MRLSAIVCMASNRVIGKDNALPWRLPADLHHFKSVTMGHAIIMGRKTHKSIGKALPGRRNIVITRDRSYLAEGCEVFHSFDDIFTALSAVDEAFLIGGANVYDSLLSCVERIYLTLVHAKIEGDAFFPELQDAFTEVARVDFARDDKNAYDYSFITLDRL